MISEPESVVITGVFKNRWRSLMSVRMQRGSAASVLLVQFHSGCTACAGG
jgi:hypothetical protein